MEQTIDSLSILSMRSSRRGARPSYRKADFRKSASSLLKAAFKRAIPLRFQRGCNSSDVTLAQRLSAIVFGSPNWRRANGVIGTSFEFDLMIKHAIDGLGSALHMEGEPLPPKTVPVYSIDRRGTLFAERLPRIWLSERTSNTRCDSGRRVFTECYPCGSDEGGNRALELAERYLGEAGMERRRGDYDTVRECLQAAEVLLLHSQSRGNAEAGSLLDGVYGQGLPVEDRWASHLEVKAKHSRPKSGRECLQGKSEN